MRIDNRMKGALSNVNHWHTWYMAMAEKEMLRVIDGNCQTPVGSVSVIDGPNIKIVAKNFETGKIAVQSAPMKEYKELGQMLGSQLI
jgi:porphobilinogen deaminase